MTEHGQQPDPRRFAPAVQRNRAPLLAVFKRQLPREGKVLEIASGTGEHAVWFAQNLTGLSWQTSDPDPALRQSIAAHIGHAGLSLPPPLGIDVLSKHWPLGDVDAVVCINMIHIAPWAATLGLLSGAARHLKPGGKLLLYGPFKRNGAHTAPSNAAFDHSLRGQNPEWGVRELDVVVREAATRGFHPPGIVEMPSNNLTVIFDFVPDPEQARSNPPG